MSEVDCDSPRSPKPQADVMPSRGPAVGVVLEEIAYFMDDMVKDLWWLLRAAHTIKGLIRGDEDLPPTPSDLEEMILRMTERTEAHLETHQTQTRSKIVIIPMITEEEKAILAPLEELSFNCKGRIILLDVENSETNHRGLWGSFHGMMGKRLPHFMLRVNPPEGGEGREYFAQCVGVVPVHVSETKDGGSKIQLFGVYCSEKKKRHWAFVGGDTKPGHADKSVLDAAKRSWAENIGIFFGKTWEESFQNDPVIYVNYEKEGVKYPIRPYVFMQVTDEFFDATKRLGGFKLPTIPNVVRYDDTDEEIKRGLHTEGYPYQAFDEAGWLDLCVETGKLTAPDERNIRKENADVLKTMPDLLWRGMFAPLLGKTEEDLLDWLGKDLPREPPFAVHVSGIDKTANDDDLKDFFENAGPHCEVKRVEQMEQPKHTAYVELADVTSLRAALRRDNDALKRRKVKVELWLGFMSSPSPEEVLKPKLQAYEGPLPDVPPFKVKVGNLDRSVAEDDVGYFFWDRACVPKSVKMGKPLPKHVAEIEFDELDSLRTALGLKGAIFKGREIHIELWEEKKTRPPETRGGRWRDEERLNSPMGSGRRGEKGDGERKKLNLKPRTVMDQDWRDQGIDAAPKSSIGRAGVTAGKETRADMDDNWRR